jgi:ATP-dependent DNA ligase
MATGCYDWTKRYPWMARSALENRSQQFVIDGEAVVLCLVLNRNMETRVHLTFGEMGR